MRAVLPLTLALWVICALVPADCAEWFVDGSVLESGNGLHPWTAFKTIQEGVDAATNGDTVIVGEGMYPENILFRGDNIILRSETPFTGSVVPNTVIDGQQAGSVVTFLGTEDETCVLAGFTIRNGKAEDGGGICGGTYEGAQTHATIQNCVIAGNSADRLGGGVAYCYGAVRSNVIAGNAAANSGGGLYGSTGIVQNNTIVANSAVNGGGVYGHGGPLVNCIIWGNAANNAPQVQEATVLRYSCIQDWSGGGEGNMSGDPRFVDLDGPDDDPLTFEDNDYHLAVASPCIDRGFNEQWMTEAFDMDGNPRIVYGRSSPTVDIGAYEFNAFPVSIVEVSMPSGAEVLLTWFSRPEDTYSVWSCIDLVSGDWINRGVVASEGAMTSWTDIGVLARMRFYRVKLR